MRNRDEQRKYEGDVQYDVWRSGGNPDRVNPDRMNDAYHDGVEVDEFVRSELRRQRPKPPETTEEK